MTTAASPTVFGGYWALVEEIAESGPTIIDLISDEAAARQQLQDLLNQGRKADIEWLEFSGCGCGG